MLRGSPQRARECGPEPMEAFTSFKICFHNYLANDVYCLFFKKKIKYTNHLRTLTHKHVFRKHMIMRKITLCPKDRNQKTYFDRA